MLSRKSRLFAGLGAALVVAACGELLPVPDPLPGTPPPAAYTLTLTDPTLSVVQGGLQAPTAVNLIRTNFTGNVTLSVENLPAGVTASFYPDEPTFGSSALLLLGVDGNAPTGTFTDLLVRGVASGLADRTAPLTLTIELPPVAPFALTLSSPALTIVQGAAPEATTVNVVRGNFTGPVTLYVDWFDSMPPGVTGAFAPSPATGDSSVLSLTVSATAVPGVYDLYVFAQSDATHDWCCAPLRLTVTARSP